MTAKDLAYHADSKYIRSIKFSVMYKKLRAWENFLDFRKRVKNTP